MVNGGVLMAMYPGPEAVFLGGFGALVAFVAGVLLVKAFHGRNKAGKGKKRNVLGMVAGLALLLIGVLLVFYFLLGLVVMYLTPVAA